MLPRLFVVSTVCVWFVSAALAPVAAGGTLPVPQKIHASDGKPADLFGSDIAVSGDVAVIAAPTNGNGVAYVFRRTAGGSWIQEQKLVASELASGSGMVVDVDGDVIVVGKPASVGGFWSSVFVFRRNVLGYWQEEAKLTGSPNFGAAVAIAGNRIFISGPAEGPSVAVYVYYSPGPGTWVFQQKLYASPPPGSFPSALGGSIAADGDVLAARAGTLAGMTVRAFRALVPEADLAPNEPAPVPQFGTRIAADGDRILVGAPDPLSIPPANQSAAYLFERAPNGVWTQVAKLTPPSGQPGYLFGIDVALDGDRAVIGSSDERAFFFERHSNGTWTLSGIGTQFLGETSAQFGEVVAFDAGVAAIGANTDADLGASAGAAYFFDFNHPPFTSHGQGCAGTGGAVPALQITGDPSAGGLVQLSITNGVGSGTTLLAVGLGAGSVWMGFGCTLNIAPVPLVMLGPLPLFPLGAQGPGAGSISLGAALPPALPPVAIGVQAFVVDAGVAHGFSNTNGVVFTIQ